LPCPSWRSPAQACCSCWTSSGRSGAGAGGAAPSLGFSLPQHLPIGGWGGFCVAIRDWTLAQMAAGTDGSWHSRPRPTGG
jgi:hypothetical protein